MNTPAMLHLDLDGAWPRDVLPDADYLDGREWGRQLRYSTKRGLIEQFFAETQSRLAAFTLYGSGDFHHLTALWLRRIAEPFTLITFDNHPDWDVRPPYWCCGTWINRALEMPNLRRAVIWGCGNFELNWPSRLFAHWRALRADRLRVQPWAERIAPSARRIWPGIQRDDWRAKFRDFAQSLHGENIYVTVDMDCLTREESVTNWEQGLFTAEDVAWALGELCGNAEMVGGDLCGAYSPVHCARWRQSIESRLDHPRIEPLDFAESSRRNRRALQIIWPALTGRNQRHSRADEQHAETKAARYFLP
jgi:hypothetical protein